MGLSGTLENIAKIEKIIFDKLDARRATSLAASPAEVCVRWVHVAEAQVAPHMGSRGMMCGEATSTAIAAPCDCFNVFLVPLIAPLIVPLIVPLQGLQGRADGTEDWRSQLLPANRLVAIHLHLAAVH